MLYCGRASPVLPRDLAHAATRRGSSSIRSTVIGSVMGGLTPRDFRACGETRRWSDEGHLAPHSGCYHSNDCEPQAHTCESCIFPLSDWGTAYEWLEELFRPGEIATSPMVKHQ